MARLVPKMHPTCKSGPYFVGFMTKMKVLKYTVTVFYGAKAIGWKGRGVCLWKAKNNTGIVRRLNSRG